MNYHERICQPIEPWVRVRLTDAALDYMPRTKTAVGILYVFYSIHWFTMHTRIAPFRHVLFVSYVLSIQ